MAQSGSNVSGFRGRLFGVIVIVVALVTLAGASLAQRHLAEASAQEMRNLIEQKVAAAAHTREVRQAVLAGICKELARQPRILAALEDDALDLLYPSAANELRQIMQERQSGSVPAARQGIRAAFYRFLDAKGKVIPPEDPLQHGKIPASGEAGLRLSEIPPKQQIGYLAYATEAGQVVEIVTVPIISTETFLPIAALVVGFPLNLQADLPSNENLDMGLWVGGELINPGQIFAEESALEDKVTTLLASPKLEDPVEINLDGEPHRVQIQPLNPGSAYPPAYGVFVSSLLPLKARQAWTRNRIYLAAGVLLVLGLVTAKVVATRMARPVEELAVSSEAEHQQRIEAETALDTTSQELERAARFSADASHQLKTPVAVVRAGLEELLVDPDLPGPLRREVQSLIRHTGRLTHVIEDLLLLSRLDAGRLDLSIQPMDLRLVIDAQLDDLSVLPQDSGIQIELDGEGPAWIHGNITYSSLILQNLLENAWKYNRPNGRIRIAVEQTPGTTICRVGNTGTPIPPERQGLIFERFHRGPSGENVSGYGLGLNLAAKLADLHGGRLRLLRSENDWTEFELTFRSASPPEDPA